MVSLSSPSPSRNEAVAAQTLIVLSGPVCAGKTTLAIQLAALGAQHLEVRALLRAQASIPLESREALQQFGASLEAETQGRWVADSVTTAAAEGTTILDAARTAAQVEACRRLQIPRIIVVHLSASRDERARRYGARKTGDPADSGGVDHFASIASDEIETNAEALRSVAELVVDTTDVDPMSVFRTVATYVGLPGQ
jgi:adenylate kinase family enzyme